MSSWTAHLIKHKGKIDPSYRNAVIALCECPRWTNVLAYNLFSLRTVLTTQPPWDISTSDWIERQWDDHDDLAAWLWMQQQGIVVPLHIVTHAVEHVAALRSFHPVQDFLNSIVWDGVLRLDGFLAKYFGATDCAYTSTVSRCTLISAIARARDAGCQCDSLLILEGSQGLGKSSAIRILFEPWFTDDLSDLGSKDASMQFAGTWCIEISELDAMNRGEVSKIKAVITRRVDRFRPPFGRRVGEYPRGCIFIGTTNSSNYLKDETGGRRFWPVVCGSIDLKGLREVRDQLLAEADVLYSKGVAWHIVAPTVLAEAEGEQAARYQGDPWTDPVMEFIEPLNNVMIPDILETCLAVAIDRQDQAAMNRCARILKANGWERYQKGSGKERSWAYRKIGSAKVKASAGVSS